MTGIISGVRESLEPTMVLVQRAFSTSHDLTVESNPQLNAVFPVLEKTAFETLAVWDFSTDEGAFRFGRCSLSRPPTFLRFLLSVWASAISTSSSSGMRLSHNPMRVSQDAVSRCSPERL